MDANQKQRIQDELASLEAEVDAAEPDSLDWDFWCRILETVEKLPTAEEEAWKAKNILKLRRAVKGVDERMPLQMRATEGAGDGEVRRGKVWPAL